MRNIRIKNELLGKMSLKKRIDEYITRIEKIDELYYQYLKKIV